MRDSTRHGLFFLSFTFLAVVLAGCAGLARPERDAAANSRGVATTFVRHVIGSDVEKAFNLLDIATLVNYGEPQTALYGSLDFEGRARYRKDFIEGVYAFLFRNLPAEQAAFTVVSAEPSRTVVEVTGRPGKTLRLTLASTADGLKIARIDKVGN